MGFLPLFFPFVLFFFSSLLDESCSLFFFFRAVSEEVRNQFCVHGLQQRWLATGLGLPEDLPALFPHILTPPCPTAITFPRAHRLASACGCWGHRAPQPGMPNQCHTTTSSLLTGAAVLCSLLEKERASTSAWQGPESGAFLPPSEP